MTRERKEAEDSILVLGAGELGMSMLLALVEVRERGEVPPVSVMLRPRPKGDAVSGQIAALGVDIVELDIAKASVDDLTEVFRGFTRVISCTGFVGGPGTQRKIAAAAIAASVAHFIPWQFGVDYDIVGRGSGQDVWDEQLDVREMLRAQSAINWTIVSTGMFTSFVFLPEFGLVIEMTRISLARTYGVEIEHSSADMSDPDAIASMIDVCRRQFGRLDILVNNASIQHVSPIETFPADKWNAILAINLSSAFHTTRLALPWMRAAGYGRIVNIASAHGLVASPFKSAYVAAKHGLLGLTKTVALEAAETGVTCNAICPGYVMTPLVEAQIEGQAKAHGIPHETDVRDILLAQQPNKRFATVEEIGALAAFLASEPAASITGAALPVDGGWTAH